MATTVKYNGVTLHNVQTERWEEEVVYDESGTDRIGSKYLLRFRGVLHAQRAPIEASKTYIDTQNAAASVFDLLQHVTAALESPRQALQVLIGGNSVIDIVPANPNNAGELPDNVDISNGPKPRRVEVTPIGGSAFRILFDIEAEISDCNKSRSGNHLVLSNRWSLAETMDSNHAITRLIRGTMRIAAGMPAPNRGVRAFKFQGLTIPPLEDSFKRDRIAYTVEPDGLTVRYEVLDRQVHTAAPWPAVRITGSHSESVQHGVYFSSEVNVRLDGDPAADKRLLIERAVQVLDARLNLQQLRFSAQVESFIVSDEIGEGASVTASAKVIQTEVPASLTYGTLLQRLGTPLKLPPLNNPQGEVDGTQYDNQLSRVPKIHGYKASSSASDWERSPLVTMFLHVYLQNPCSDQHQVGPVEEVFDSTETRGVKRTRSTSVTEVPHTPAVVDEFNTYSTSTSRAMYTTAEMTSRYHTDRMRVQMPVASGDNAGPSSQVISLAKPQAYRYIALNLERVGAEPEIPEPLDTYQDRGVNAYLKFFDVELLPPVRSPDGRQRIERRIAKYLYLLDREPDFTRPLPVGVNPVTGFPDHDGKATLNLTGSMGVDESRGSFTNS